MGKRTTTRHKEDNTFRFQTFEEKLRQISVNVNLSIRDGRGENPDGRDTFVSQEIEKWVDLNRTETFADLLCNIGTDSKTLPQLLLQKDTLAKILLEHLQNGGNVASFEPAFALTIALSRDLGEEFYPHFQEFFKVIVKIIMESKSTNIIEAGFKCYAYLSKYLRRQIIKDLPEHMKQFACFLDPKLKAYVMIFACEAFSIVSGKFARDYPEKFLKLLYNVFLRKTPEHAVGVATLLFSIFKGVAGTLKLNGPGMPFKDCVLFLSNLTSSEEKEVWTKVLSQLTIRLLNHANAANSEELIRLIEALILNDLNENRSITNLLTVYLSMIEFNNAGRFTDISSCAKLLESLSSNNNVCRDNSHLVTKAIVKIIESKCSSFDTEILSLLQPSIISLLKIVDFDKLETLDKCLRGFKSYFRMFLEHVIEAYSSCEHKPDYIQDCPNLAVYCLSEAILQQGGLYQVSSDSSNYFTGCTSPVHYFQGQKRIITTINASNIKGTIWNCCKLLKELKISVKNDLTFEKGSYYIRALLVFSRLNSKNCENCLRASIDILSSIMSLEVTSDRTKSLPAIFYILQIFVTQSCPNATFYTDVPLKDILKFLESSVSGAVSEKEFSIWSLKVLDVLVYFVSSSNFEPYENILKEFVEQNWESLMNNLMSGFRMVRALTLSILRGVAYLSSNSSEKTVEMLDRFLELENMSLTNNKFTSLGKSILTENKVVVGSDNYDISVKMFCVKYTLGLLYTNFNLIWTPCVEVIRHAGKNIDMKIFWKTFGKHFRLNAEYPNDSPDMYLRTEILLDIDEDCTDFLELLMVETFALPKSDEGYHGFQEDLDVTQYKINLWTSLKGQCLSKEEYSDIKDIVNDAIRFTEINNDSESDGKKPIKMREHFKIIIRVLQFLETCDLVNVNHELWESALKYLTYPQDVQKAAWKFLFAKRKSKFKNYKEAIDEVINSDSMDPVHKFRIDAVDTTLNKQYENETADRRTLLMEILIRILIGKERVMKGEKRLQVLRFLAGCSEEDARKYLDLTVGSPNEMKQLPPKIIEIKINKMTSALRVWRYRFPTILDQIINSVCDLSSSIQSSTKPLSKGSDEEIPDSVFEEQKKAALKAGRICLVAFFSSLPRLNMKKDTLNRVFDVFIWSALNDMVSTSVGSVSWILKLFLVWSTHERYHVLFTKCKGGDVTYSPMRSLFDLLDSNSAVFEVKKYILGIIFNLTSPPDITDDPEDTPMEYLENSSNSPLNIDNAYEFATSETIGVNVVLLGKEVILNLFQDAQTFKKLTSHSGGGNCLELISLLAGFATSRELMNKKLCHVIIDTFQMCKNNEEALANSISAVGKLLLNIEDSSNLLLKLSPSFNWIKGRRLRTCLVEALSCNKGTELHEIVVGMNTWTESAADTPNFSQRQASFEKAIELIQNNDFDMLTYALIFHNCIYNIVHEDDIGMRNAAKNVLLTMASCLPEKAKSSDNDKTSVNKFLDVVFLSRFRGCIREKDDKRYEDILRIMFAFTTSCQELHGTFKELQKILTLEIIEGLCDIQVHLRTRAMNKLAKKLKDTANDVSPAVIQAYILPMASHNLFDEDRLSKNFNELVDSSIEVLKEVMLAISHEQYFAYLNKLLDDPKKNTRLAKQYERILIAIMDAFHFDLSLACPNDPKLAGSSVVRSEQSSKPQIHSENSVSEIEKGKTNENGQAVADGSEEDEEGTEKEEFNIPSESVQNPMILLPEPAAVKCIGTLRGQIIPKLRKFLHFEEKATHKLSKATKTVDNDVILKIPCTIALVKLLKKIPKSEGQNGIRSIIPSITAGLRNELVSVRNTLRKTLLSVVKELGTSHLRVVIGYLKSSLLRGYQRHVLNYTVAYLLRCLENELKANPQHVPVKEVLPLCEEELYGSMQEEKDVQAIKQKTREASKSNACPILKVCSKCVSTVEQLNSLINPAIKHLSEKKSIKVAKSSRQWLQSVTEGLTDNNAVDYYEMLEWLLEVVKKDGTLANNTSIEDTSNQNNEKDNNDQPPNKKRKLLETPQDSKLIPILKKKSISEGKHGGQSLLMEFGFSCLYSGLNKSGRFKLEVSTDESLVVLDSFVPILADGIKTASKQVNVVSLRCITLLMEFDLASFKKPEIIDKMQRNGFVAMSTHCYRNTTDSEITNSTFKFLSAFFVRFPDYKIVLQDFELMLKCIQGYLTDGNCSSSALTLLRGVLQNKYRSKLLPELMQEVFKQCITSYYQHINEGCRQAYLVYLNNYLTNPKDLYVEVQLILRQLDYEHENGRVTAAEILNSLLQNIPEDCFEEVKELIFLKLLATLDKEKISKVREKLGDAIKSLFKLEQKKSLVRILLKLLVLDKHVPELDTFFLIIGLLINDPKIFNNDDMTVIIRRIKEVLDPKTLEGMCSQSSDRITQQIKDYMIFQSLVALKKSFSRNVFDLELWDCKSPLQDEMFTICSLLRDTYLLYEHEWVPLIAVDIISIVLNKLQLTEEVSKCTTAANLGKGKPICIFLGKTDDLNQLVGKLWTAMRTSEREDVLAKGAYALVILVSLAARLKDKTIFVEAIKSIKKSVNAEVVKNSRVTTIRTVAMGCFRGIAKSCPRDAIELVAEVMTRVAVREITDDNISGDLKTEAEKLISVLRDIIGSSEYNIIHAKVTDFLFKKRNLNKAKKKEKVMLHPGLVRKRPKKTKNNFQAKKKRKLK